MGRPETFRLGVDPVVPTRPPLPLPLSLSVSVKRRAQETFWPALAYLQLAVEAAITASGRVADQVVAIPRVSREASGATNSHSTAAEVVAVAVATAPAIRPTASSPAAWSIAPFTTLAPRSMRSIATPARW